MTRRPAFVYALFAACLLFAALGATWLSWTVVQRDHAEARARRQALLEENVRLALWRIDSEIATLIATENARPYFDYSAFRSLERAYGEMVNALTADEPVEASPLLVARPEYVKLHFQYVPETDDLTSPQVPVSTFSARAAEIVGTNALRETRRLRAALIETAAPDRILAELETARARTIARAPPPAPPTKIFSRSSSGKNAEEYRQRSRSIQQASTYNVDSNIGIANPMVGTRGRNERLAEHSLVPLWIGEELLLVRRVQVGADVYVQGLWLDWAKMRAALRTSIDDLLPSAELVPIRDAAIESANLLASLPVQLEPGALPLSPIETSLGTLLSLAAVWIGFLLAGAAMIVLVVGATSLSERRAVFVSAVTHELRTPLTTFRMYTEMLSEGMVTDEAKRRRYLDTLRREAIRLAHLVENVLAYARIERGSATARTETIAIPELLERMLERLEERAAQVGMPIVATNVDAEVSVRADPSAVEQILFNLVDNACKYAAAAEDRRIHLDVTTEARRVHIVVRDHGPGIHGPERRSLFSAFSKSAQRAAVSAPGVGLGLALSRRLARDMGARLTFADAPGGGACFTLTFHVA